MKTSDSTKDLVLSNGNYTKISNNEIKSLSGIENIRANDLVVYASLCHQSYVIGKNNFIIKSFRQKFNIGEKQYKSSVEILEKNGFIKIERHGSRFQRLHITSNNSISKDFSTISNELLQADKKLLTIAEKAFIILFWEYIQPNGNHFDINYYDISIEDVLGNYATVRWFENQKKSLADKEVILVENQNRFFFKLNPIMIAKIIGVVGLVKDVRNNDLEQENIKLKMENRELKRSIGYKKSDTKKISTSKNDEKNNSGFKGYDYGIDLDW